MSHNCLWAELCTASSCHCGLVCLHLFSSQFIYTDTCPSLSHYKIFTKWGGELGVSVLLLLLPLTIIQRVVLVCFYSMGLVSHFASLVWAVALGFHIHFQSQLLSWDGNQSVILLLSLLRTLWANRTTDFHLFLFCRFSVTFCLFVCIFIFSLPVRTFCIWLLWLTPSAGYDQIVSWWAGNALVPNGPMG